MKIIRIMALIYIFIITIMASPSIEIEGCFSLTQFDRSLTMSINEKVGLVMNRVCISMFGEQKFRNNSFINSVCTGVDYRFGKNQIQIPAGVFAGFNNIYIGNYNLYLTVAGLNTGCIIWLSDKTSLRVNYYGKWFFDTRTVFGSDLMVGLGYVIRGGKI